MSLLSWLIIALRGLTLIARRSLSPPWNFFWNATSLDAVAHEIATHGARDPFSPLANTRDAQAQSHHARLQRGQMEAGGASDRHPHHQEGARRETTRMENGLAVLATVGTTAPFIGLFGGLGRVPRAGGDRHGRRRHARSRQSPAHGGRGADHDRPGPRGIPAVVAYSWLARQPRAALSRLDAFIPAGCIFRPRWASRWRTLPTDVTTVHLPRWRRARRGLAQNRSGPPARFTTQQQRRSPRSTWSPLIDVMLVLLIDLHRHRAAAPCPPSARTAAPALDQRAKADKVSSRSTRAARWPLETASPSRARTLNALRPPASSNRSPRSTCAPTRPVPYKRRPHARRRLARQAHQAEAS